MIFHVGGLRIVAQVSHPTGRMVRLASKNGGGFYAHGVSGPLQIATQDRLCGHPSRWLSPESAEWTMFLDPEFESGLVPLSLLARTGRLSDKHFRAVSGLEGADPWTYHLKYPQDAFDWQLTWLRATRLLAADVVQAKAQKGRPLELDAKEVQLTEWSIVDTPADPSQAGSTGRPRFARHLSRVTATHLGTYPVTPDLPAQLKSYGAKLVLQACALAGITF